MSKELKPCPFCGGKPIIKLVGDNRDYFVYSCGKCHKTPVHQDEARLTRWGARRIWNRRVNDGKND